MECIVSYSILVDGGGGLKRDFIHLKDCDEVTHWVIIFFYHVLKFSVVWLAMLKVNILFMVFLLLEVWFVFHIYFLLMIVCCLLKLELFTTIFKVRSIFIKYLINVKKFYKNTFILKHMLWNILCTPQWF